MSGINDNAFKTGRKKMRSLVDRYLSISANAVSEVILKHVRDNAEYFNVTGNTMGSISCGIYKDGVLLRVEQPFTREIKERTLKKGEKRVFGKKNGDSKRVFVAETGDRKYFADEEARKFLMSFKPSINGFAIVFCVGTEYATYLEKSKELNVITETFNNVKSSGVNLFQRELKFSLDHVSSTGSFNVPTSFSAPF